MLKQTLEPFDCEWLCFSKRSAVAISRYKHPRVTGLTPELHPTLPCLLPLPADGIAFHANSSDALVDEWSRAVLRLQVCCA